MHIGRVNQTQVQAYVYECPDNYSFTVGIQDNIARIYFPDRTLELPHAFSFTGAKFSARQATLWIKDAQARLEIETVMHDECINNPGRASWESAKLNGVGFRALGNQSSWILEILQGNTVIFADYNYQIKKYIFTNADTEIDKAAGKSIYKANNDEHRISIILTGKPCQNIISGESFDFSVKVILDNKSYTGCGRSLI